MALNPKVFVGQKPTQIVLPDLTQVASQVAKANINASANQNARAQVIQLSQAQISQLARTINLSQPIAVGAAKPIKFGSVASLWFISGIMLRTADVIYIEHKLDRIIYMLKQVEEKMEENNKNYWYGGILVDDFKNKIREILEKTENINRLVHEMRIYSFNKRGVISDSSFKRYDIF